jgi:hypothetical protein
MPRFVSQKDFNFFQHINRELVSDVVDVDVILYKIALETTAVNLYGEATEKARYTGVELKSLVRYPKNIEFRFVRALLEQVKTYPEAGDIIFYDEAYYEIDNVNDTQLVAGQPQYTTSILCNAHLTRRSNIQIEEANT